MVDITTSNTLTPVMEEAEMHVVVSDNLPLTGKAGFVHKCARLQPAEEAGRCNAREHQPRKEINGWFLKEAN